MKVIHVIGSCSPGGAEILAKDLLVEMKKQGIDVGLWIMTKVKDTKNPSRIRIEFESAFTEELKAYNIPYAFVNKRPNKDWLKATLKINQLYKKDKPEIIHTHLESVAFHVGRSLFFRKVVLIHTIHSILVKNPLIVKFFLSKVYEKFVAISEKVKKSTEVVGVPIKKIKVIMNGINVDKFSTFERLPSIKAKSIVAIGRLTEAKNYENLIAAISILKMQLFQIQVELPKVHLVGDGELKEQLLKLVNENKLEDDILFLGLRNDIPHLLKINDIYVMSSKWEGLSISLIEAMASGISVVATDAGSNSEIIEHEKDGLIVPVADSQALANGLFRLITESNLRHKFEKTAPDKALSFSITSCANRHLDLYKNLSYGKNKRS